MQRLTQATLILATALALPSLANADNALNYNVVNLNAEATRQISNDEMHATLYIEKTNKQPAQLASEITQLMNQALATAAKYPSVKIETGTQNTYPVYDNDNRKLKEWRGRAQVRIESTDFKAASQLISELQQNFQTESINFTVSNAQKKKVENELMIEASKNFQQRAQTLAQSWNKSGYQLVSLNMNTNNFSHQPIPRMAMMKSATAEMAVSDQDVAAGESQMTVNASGAIQFK